MFNLVCTLTVLIQPSRDQTQHRRVDRTACNIKTFYGRFRDAIHIDMYLKVRSKIHYICEEGFATHNFRLGTVNIDTSRRAISASIRCCRSSSSTSSSSSLS